MRQFLMHMLALSIAGLPVTSSSLAAPPTAKPAPTAMCVPQSADGRPSGTAVAALSDGEIRVCSEASKQCVLVTGLPANYSVQSLACDKNLYFWVGYSNGSIYRCLGSPGQVSCASMSY